MARLKTVSLLIPVLLVSAWVGLTLVRPQALVAVLDVGQGDAIFITTSSGEDILIDGGNNTRVLEHIGGLLPIMDRDIELMLLTHPHADHVNGLIDVVERYDVKRIFCACEGGKSKLFHVWEALANGDAPVETVLGPEQIIFEGGATITIWHPPANEKSLNDQSLIALYEDQGKRFLFTGDAEIPSEEWLIDQGFDTDIDVLKVGHHGSRNATGNNLLTITKPEIAVISLGEGNRYNHPHAEALKRLSDSNIKIYRTDQQGSVIFWRFQEEWHTSAMHERLMPLIADLWYNQSI